MKTNFSLLGALLLLLLIACNQSALEKNNAAYTSETGEAGTNYGTDSIHGNNEQRQRQPTQNQPVANPDWDKKIIRTATLHLEVQDYNKYYTVLRESVKRAGGYIASENQTQSEYKLENAVTVKVPVAQFEDAMNLLAAGTGKDKVLERTVSSQDVTSEVVDTKSRMEAKREVRLRYLELLRQAKNMDEILKVQNEINEIHEQIEMGTGRVNFLNHASALSTIQLTFYQVLNPTAHRPSEPSFFTKTWHAFERGWNFIKDVILALITIWPLWLAVFGIWFGIKRLRIGRREATNH